MTEGGRGVGGRGEAYERGGREGAAAQCVRIARKRRVGNVITKRLGAVYPFPPN